MSNYTYTKGRPVGNQSPAAQRSTLQTNNDSAFDIWTEDHFGFEDDAGGTHKQVTFSGNNEPSSPTNPPVLFTNTQDGAGTTLPGSLAQLFFYTGEESKSKDQYRSQSPGSVLLPGGIVVKWGYGTATTAGSSNSFVTPFPTTCFGVVLTAIQAGGSDVVFLKTGPTASAFTAFSTSFGTSTIFYLAIGN
jgi:hypothetical protein